MNKLSPKLKNQKGMLIWITGLAGAGKSTLALELYNRIKGIMPAVLIDGDVFREIIGDNLGHGIEDRRVVAFRIARMNKFLVDYNINVICATISLFKEIHNWNKKNIPNLIEVFIDVPMDILKARDHKNIYSRAIRGELGNVMGIHHKFDKPKNPSFVLVNDKKLDSFFKKAEEIAELIFNNYDKNN